MWILQFPEKTLSELPMILKIKFLYKNYSVFLAPLLFYFRVLIHLLLQKPVFVKERLLFVSFFFNKASSIKERLTVFMDSSLVDFIFS